MTPATNEKSAKEEKALRKQLAREKDAVKKRKLEPSLKEEDEFYQSVVLEQQQAKATKLQKIVDGKEEHKEKAKQMYAKAQRNINYNILKAKGLTRKRKKIDRNPRVKLRSKYEKAVRIRKVFIYGERHSMR